MHIELNCPILLTAIPTGLLYGIITLVLGVVAVVICVVLLLPDRDLEETEDWEAGTGTALKRGQYLQHLTRLLRAIRAINSIIITERDKEQLLERACRTLTETRGYKMAWVGVVEQEGKRVRPVGQAGFEEGYLDAIEVTWDDSPTGLGPTGQAIKTGEPTVMRDIETDVAYRPWREEALKRGYRSSAALPLRFEGRVLATLNVYSEMPDAFDIQEVGLLQEVADHIAYALGTIELLEEIEELRGQLDACAMQQAVCERAPVPLVSADGEGRITAVSEQARRLLGSGDADLAGRPLRELTPFHSAAAQQALQRLYDGSDPVQFCWQQEAGEEASRHCRGRAILSDGGDVVGSVWVLSTDAVTAP